MFSTPVPLPSPHHTVVVKFPDDIDGQISTCKDVVYKMNHTTWVTPADVKPSLTDVATEIGKLDTATALANTHADGTAEARLAELKVVKRMISQIATGYVQQLVDATIGHEKEIAQSCGMDTKISKGRRPNEDKVAATGIDGEVEFKCRTKPGKNAIHEIQVNLDQNDPKRWYEYPITCQHRSKKIIGGMPINVDLFFRHRLIIDDIPQEWGTILKIKLTH